MSALDALVRSLLDYVGAHPQLGVLVVFLAALSESIPVVGAVFPGTAVVIGAGALVGLGQLPLWPVMAAATLGAILSDGLAYWLGRRLGARAFAVWPLSRHPEAVASAQRFFDSHGGKSVAAARFTPVVRAVVPLIAGASGMPPGRFYAANVLSALAWAPSHVLPGALLGVSLGALGRLSGRSLAILLGIVVAAALLAWLLRWLWSRGLVLLAQGQERLHARLARRPGRAAGALRRLLDPAEPSARQVAVLGGVTALAAWAFAVLTEDVLDRGQLGRADAAIAHLVTSLRSDWSDRALTAITTLADTPVTAAVGLAAALALWLLGQRRAGVGLLAVVAATAAVTLALKATTRIPRPSAIYAGAVEYSFPSGHVTFVAATLGVLGWLLARDLERPWRGLAAGTVAAAVATVAASRIYLGAHWPSDVTAGAIWGLGATAAYALAFRHLRLTGRERLLTLAAALMALGLVGGWNLRTTYGEALARYTPAAPARVVLTEAEWRNGAWGDLPARRIDLGGDGEEPLSLQWAGPPEALAATLARAGWTAAPALGIGSLNLLLSGRTSLAELPVPPRLHDGAPPVLALTRPLPDGGRLVLRAWDSGRSVDGTGDARPLLLVALDREALLRPLGLLSLPWEPEAAGPGPGPQTVAADLPGATVMPRGSDPAAGPVALAEAPP